MIQAPPDARSLVDEIVARLISRFSPRRIYLFGSRARGDAHADSDYDFLIEVDALPTDVVLTPQGMTWLRDFPCTEVQVHVRSPGGFERKKDDPGTVDWDVVREGILLFALEDLPAIRAGAAPNMVWEGARTPPRSLGGWLRHAERDMRVASHLTSDFSEWKETICFHAQQASEKFLKALIIAQHARPARTHDILELLHQVRLLGLDIGDLEDDARFMEPFAVTIRYPDDEDDAAAPIPGDIAPPVIVTEAQARRAFAIAKRIEAAVRAHLQ